MEQHPVPQNVTTFQFRLIGDMTLKQFGYLAGGAILAYISYKLPLPFFIDWPLAIMFALGGVGFAFVPIEERPMDVWVLSFFKSVYSPTQYVWSRQAPAPVQSPPSQQAPTAIPAPSVQPSGFPSRRENILQSIFSPKGATAPQQPPAAPAPPVPALDFTPPPRVTSKPPQNEIIETQKREQAVDEKLKSLQTELAAKNPADTQAAQLQKQLADLRAERQKMETELAALRAQVSQTPPPQPLPASPPPPAQKPPQESSSVATPGIPKPPTIQIITPDRAVKAGLPRLTSFPNVVTGIIKDSENNLLPGVLVTVKDKDGIPLRALKTNRIGQFAASTPMPNGVYFIEVEDPRMRFAFDRAQVTLNGTVVPAIEIFAKSQKEITRAKLEKEIFGNKTQ